jgi:hypothetical protein
VTLRDLVFGASRRLETLNVNESDARCADYSLILRSGESSSILHPSKCCRSSYSRRVVPLAVRHEDMRIVEATMSPACPRADQSVDIERIDAKSLRNFQIYWHRLPSKISTTMTTPMRTPSNGTMPFCFFPLEVMEVELSKFMDGEAAGGHDRPVSLMNSLPKSRRSCAREILVTESPSAGSLPRRAHIS